MHGEPGTVRYGAGVALPPPESARPEYARVIEFEFPHLPRRNQLDRAAGLPPRLRPALSPGCDPGPGARGPGPA